MNPRVKRSEVIFNEINIDWSEELTIVEGPFDLMKSNQNATCLLGSTLNQRHALFKKIVANKTPVLLALDPDASKKTQDIATLLYSFDIAVKVLDIYPYDDVGEMIYDCEVCCRPWTLRVWLDEEGNVHATASR